jgi:hypothetical protein
MIISRWPSSLSTKGSRPCFYVAEWIKITERISSQLATKMERGHPESGVNSAARELGIDKDDAHQQCGSPRIWA